MLDFSTLERGHGADLEERLPAQAKDYSSGYYLKTNYCCGRIYKAWMVGAQPMLSLQIKC
jgi:hypothetical protein